MVALRKQQPWGGRQGQIGNTAGHQIGAHQSGLTSGTPIARAMSPSSSADRIEICRHWYGGAAPNCLRMDIGLAQQSANALDAGEKQPDRRHWRFPGRRRAAIDQQGFRPAHEGRFDKSLTPCNSFAETTYSQSMPERDAEETDLSGCLPAAGAQGPQALGAWRRGGSKVIATDPMSTTAAHFPNGRGRALSQERYGAACVLHRPQISD
jgi:hypothetical protein